MAASSAGPARALYYSRVRATLTPRIIGLVVIAFGPVVAVLAILKDTPEVLWVPVVTTAAGSFIAFMSVTVKVDEQNVVIAFCDVFKRKLPRQEISIVTSDKAAGPSGYGFRVMGPSMVGYVVGGPEINIEMRNGKTVLASTDQPETLIRVLTEPKN